MSCQITVPGDGQGRYGKPKVTKTGPIEAFLVDNTVYYSAVSVHVFGRKKGQECRACDPEALLRVWLSRRVNDVKKFGGLTSTGLIEHALSWERRASKQGRPIPRSLVDEFLWRGGWHQVSKHVGRLDVYDAYRGLRLSKPPADLPLSGKFGAIARIAAAADELPAEEVERLLTVAEVLTS